MDLQKRVDRRRYVFHVQGEIEMLSLICIFNSNIFPIKIVQFITVAIEGSSMRANVGDFVLVEADKCQKFFAYVTIQRFTSKNSSISN